MESDHQLQGNHAKEATYTFYEFCGHESLSNFDIASRTRGGRQGVSSGEQNAVPSSPWCAVTMKINENQ